MSGDVTDDLRESTQRAGLQLLQKPVQAAKLRTLLHHLRAQQQPADATSS